VEERDMVDVNTKLPRLSQGSKGAAVKVLQTILNAEGAGLSVDGSFGPKTAAAVKEFQKKHGLAADAIVGRKTWPALMEVH
jgi:peptidoglycan hydrolase-like protein with peptidoglycan-binding domain